MKGFDEVAQPHIATINLDGRTYNVSVRLSYDGTEHTGRLWFAEDGWDDAGVPDRGLLPGRTESEVMDLARDLSVEELRARYHRAKANRRRYKALRTVTEEMLAKVRYLNQVSVSMHAGLIDLEGAAGEIDLTEQQLHALVGRLRDSAGVESYDQQER